MKNTLETRLGIFFALALLAAAIVVEMVGNFSWFAHGVEVRAMFDRVQELRVGDPVKMAGVGIGRVTKIRLSTNEVEVRLELTKPDLVKTDSTASIKFTGLLGQNYVSIDFGSPGAPSVTEGTILKTTEQADLSSLMVKLEGVATGVENLTRSFGGNNLNNILGPFTDFLKENSPNLSAILTNMEAISGQIAQGKGTVGRMINEDTLYTSALTAVTNLSATADEIQSTVAEAREVVDQLKEGKGTLGKLTSDDELYQQAMTAVSNLKEILEKINQGQGSVGKLVNDESMFRNIKLTLQKVEKATEGIEDQGALSVLGTAVGTLF